MRISRRWSFFALALLAGSWVAADEGGPAGWLPCDSGDTSCIGGKPIALPQARDKAVLTSTPACPDAVPSSGKLLDKVLRGERVDADTGAGCESISEDDGKGGRTVGVSCAASRNHSSCASVCIVADRQPEYDYAYVRLCMQGHLLPSISMSAKLPKLESGSLQDWCVWDGRNSLEIPYAAITQFKTKLSPDGKRFAACATGVNWSNSESRTLSMQALMAKQPLPAPTESGQTASYHALKSGAAVSVTAAAVSAPAVKKTPSDVPAPQSGGSSMTDSQLIANAMSAAPRELALAASVVAIGTDGAARTLRQGSNGFICMPGGAENSTANPMCMDRNAREWIQAYLSHGTPPSGKMGLVYMLAGDAASTTDPYARGPSADNHWTRSGPHLMIVGADASFYDQYPRSADPRTSGPYVRWAGTPYQHLVAPIK